MMLKFCLGEPGLLSLSYAQYRLIALRLATTSSSSGNNTSTVDNSSSNNHNNNSEPHRQQQPSLAVPDVKQLPEFLKFVETKWRRKLERRFDREKCVDLAEEAKDGSPAPRYILSMFPYPSGRLHLGHVRIYTSGDILARFSRMLVKSSDKYPINFNRVVHPMGFDSFGLPAENAARERGLDPGAWTNSNIRTMKRQLDDLALQFDWREATSNVSYYKWTQDLFVQLMEAGLVYKSFASVNWDPVDKTVLADEQVDADGRSWRSGAKVEQRNLSQWFVKVNALTNEIYHSEEVDLESWADVIGIQRGWIGTPSGWLFYLPVQLSPQSGEPPDTLPVFTREPELFVNGHGRLHINANHWLERVRQLVSVGGGQLTNPFTGTSLEVVISSESELPESGYAYLAGSGAKNDAADSATDAAKQQHNLQRQQVISQAKVQGFGGYFTSAKYRDWLVSRQRFWGTPIPVVHCHKCGPQGLGRDSLPVALPAISERLFDEANSKAAVEKETDNFRVPSPLELYAPDEWRRAKCPSCAGSATRECETFDTLFDSSWYFLRYAGRPPADRPFDAERVQPVWCYIGGKEHAAMHLLYARFVTRFLHSQGALPFAEPFRRLLVQGVVKGKTYKLNGRYLTSEQAAASADKGNLQVEFEKMSKSKGNGVDPQDLLDEYGIDATRFCLMYYVNPRSERLWRSTKEEFQEVMIHLRRVVLTVREYLDAASVLRNNQNRGTKNASTIKQLDDDQLATARRTLSEGRNKASIDSVYYIQEVNLFRQFITCVQVLLNTLRNHSKTSAVYTEEFAEALATLLVLHHPVVPHLCEELWHHFALNAINPLRNQTGGRFNVNLQAADQAWPIADEHYPRFIRVRPLNTPTSHTQIPVPLEEFRQLTDSSIKELIENHYQEQGDLCKVFNVRKCDELVAIAEARIQSVIDEKKAKKLEKRRKQANNSRDDQCSMS